MQTYEVEVEVQGAEPQTVGRKQRYEVRSTTVGQAAKEAISDFLHDQGVNLIERNRASSAYKEESCRRLVVEANRR